MVNGYVLMVQTVHHSLRMTKFFYAFKVGENSKSRVLVPTPHYLPLTYTCIRFNFSQPLIPVLLLSMIYWEVD